jgi:hypothetical protein
MATVANQKGEIGLRALRLVKTIAVRVVPSSFAIPSGSARGERIMTIANKTPQTVVAPHGQRFWSILILASDKYNSS